MAYEGVVLKNEFYHLRGGLALEWNQEIRVRLGYLSISYNDLGYWIWLASVSTGSSSNLNPTKPYKDNTIDNQQPTKG